MNVKIAMRSGLAALLALSLSACDIEQYINFILDPGTGDLLAVEMPASWEDTNIQNFGSFDAGKASQRLMLWNVDWDNMNTGLTIEAFDETGAFLGNNPDPITYRVDDTNVPLILDIAPGSSRTNANDFVQDDIATTVPFEDTSRVEFRPLLFVERLNPNIPVIACAEVYYDGFSLDLKCEVLF